MIRPGKPTANDVERLLRRLESVGHDTTKVAAYLRAWVGPREPGEDDGEDDGADEELIPIGEVIRQVTARGNEREMRANERRGQLEALKRRCG